jgi:23S rRNA (guanosine2251-2'-O)-methyltransferase
VTITPAVTKVSAGASELLPLCSVSNLRNALLELKRAGFWVCVAGVGSSAQSIYDVELPEKVVVVLGSEGRGVQPLIQKEADLLLEIPMLGRIDSLNVAQATAVFLATYRSHHGKRS